ncbi:MAG TPA: biotin/lipoyl-binding protein, partial [Usitatibacteraceae bacterium]|nr:biotin/lipoyl-binding protein [Usitatibacteraceae bacterium]
MKTLQIAGAVALLAAVGTASYLAGRSTAPGRASPPSPATAAPKGPGAGAPAGVAVVAGPPAVVRLPQSITTVGSLRSDEAVIVRPEVAGRVAEISFREGQRVTKGQVLIRLDDSVQRADLERARANLTLSKSKYERAVDLRAKGFISGQAKDEAENTL